MMKEICQHNECTGCSACVNVCGKNAIFYCEDKIGFRYPVVNLDLCIDCGLCQKVCPNNVEVDKSEPTLCFVGHATDRSEQETSSSGGIASLLSRTIIRQGGVVYGCTARDISHVQHIRVNNDDDLFLLKGSKYVQSDLGDCYKRIKVDLHSNLQVIFIGTPCQIAGLRTYLRKDYENLVTIDFVCHGVPSQIILNESLRTKTNENLRECTLSFRRKIKNGKKIDSKYGLFLDNKKDNLCIMECIQRICISLVFYRHCTIANHVTSANMQPPRELAILLWEIMQTGIANTANYLEVIFCYQ